MNKEFIPYEQALALKELGFDEPCFAYFVDGELRGINLGIEELGGKEPYYQRFGFHTLSNHDIDNQNKIVSTAPLYQQAFRWFRKVYGLKHDIQDDRKGEKFYYAITSYTPKFDQYDDVLFHIRKEVDWHEIEFKSYEEAELACLNKLIEIVKNKTL